MPRYSSKSPHCFSMRETRMSGDGRKGIGPHSVGPHSGGLVSWVLREEAVMSAAAGLAPNSSADPAPLRRQYSLTGSSYRYCFGPPLGVLIFCSYLLSGPASSALEKLKTRYFKGRFYAKSAPACCYNVVLQRESLTSARLRWRPQIQHAGLLASSAH